MKTIQAPDILEPHGPLSHILKGFEPRKEQQKMMEEVFRAYEEDAIALIEAGTGTGKSVAYLIPAILWALENKERTLISTNTISLQEQLLKKDIPLVSKALQASIKAVLVKGMSNYICKRKLEQALQERLLYKEEEAEEIEKVDQWEREADIGSRSDLPFAPSPQTWERVSAESDTCTHRKCPHFKECHFFKARQEAESAQILVANHHMLFADLAVRQNSEEKEKDPGLLPNYRRVILDEAHHVEEVATEFMAAKTNHFEIRRFLLRLMGEKQGKFLTLYQMIKMHFRSNNPKGLPSILQRMEIDLPGERSQALEELERTFTSCQTFLDFFIETGRGTKLRLLPHHYEHPAWQEMLPHAKALINSLSRLTQGVHALLQDIKHLNQTPFDEATLTVRQEIRALTQRLEGATEVLNNFIEGRKQEEKVRWIEARTKNNWTNLTFVDAELEVSRHLPEILFQPFATTLLCSATLTTNQTFSFIRQRLGLDEKNMGSRPILEKVFESPFNYKKQALLLVPTDLPSPNDAAFDARACESIVQALHASGGNAFILFTSYSMLSSCYETLRAPLLARGYTVFRQGEDNRHSLLMRFKDAKRGVLFGTDSFWEGVDVAGDDLKLVVLVKLPFQVPSEPIIEARTEAILKQGGNPFMEYAVPNAIVKFKQGFGRLIRHKKDRGCILCLDNRLYSKPYGQLFINSLPECAQLYADSTQIHKEMLSFYRRRPPQ